MVEARVKKPSMGYGFVRFRDVGTSSLTPTQTIHILTIPTDTATTAIRHLNGGVHFGGNRVIKVDYSDNKHGGNSSNQNQSHHQQSSHSQHNQHHAPPPMNGYPIPPPGYGQPPQQYAPPSLLPQAGALVTHLPDGVPPQHAIDDTIKTLDPWQMITIIQQMKTLVSSPDPKGQEGAAEFLKGAPQVTYALFAALVLYGLVDPQTIGEYVSKSGQAGGPAQGGAQMQVPMHGGQPAQGYGQQPQQGYQYAPQQPQYGVPPPQAAYPTPTPAPASYSQPVAPVPVTGQRSAESLAILPEAEAAVIAPIAAQFDASQFFAQGMTDELRAKINESRRLQGLSMLG